MMKDEPTAYDVKQTAASATETDNAYPPGLKSYQYPDGDFCVAMSIIVDTLQKNVESDYYNEECVRELTLTKDVMLILQFLQAAYDNHMANITKSVKRKGIRIPECRKRVKHYYFKLLQHLTGFSFDNPEHNPEALSARIVVDSETSESYIADILDEEDICFDRDSGGRFMVHPSQAEDLIELFTESGIKARRIL